MRYDELTNGQVKAVVQKMGGPLVALAFLRGGFKVVRKVPPRHYPLAVDGEIPPKELIALGQYHYEVSEEVISAVGISAGRWNIKTVLVEGHGIASNEAPDVLASLGLRCATLRELLTFRVAYPYIQSPISQEEDIDDIRVFGGYDSKRGLNLFALVKPLIGRDSVALYQSTWSAGERLDDDRTRILAVVL